MEIRWLEDFLSLVDTRNFSRSAELRFTTQPAFSRRIKSLEEWVGTTLFDRGTQPVSLTAAGEMFRPLAEEVLRRLYQGREDIRRADQAAANTIFFAATHSLSLTFFPSWLRSIESRTGVLSTRLDSTQVAECVQSLLKGRCHFMICHTHSSVDLDLPGNHYTSVVVGQDRLIPLSVPDAYGSPVHSLPGSDSAPVDYLAYADTSAIGRAIRHMLAEKSPQPHLNRVFVCHLAAVMLSMILDGRGVGWIPESQVREEIYSGKVVQAGGGAWVLPVEIRLFRTHDPLPSKAEEFWSMLSKLTT